MTKIDYKKVKCPKCGKSYFRVKENNGLDMSLLVFTTKPDPIYKDGELQNPTEDEPIKERCECLECGCNFRVEMHDVFGEYQFIDEDEELEENKRKLFEGFSAPKREPEELKTELKLAVDPSWEVSSYDSSSDTLTTFVTRKEFDDLKERIARLEK